MYHIETYNKHIETVLYLGKAKQLKILSAHNMQYAKLRPGDVNQTSYILLDPMTPV